MTLEELKNKILKLSADYSRHQHAGQRPGSDPSKPEFIPGKTPVPYAARTFTEDEVVAAVNSVIDFWLTL